MRTVNAFRRSLIIGSALAGVNKSLLAQAMAWPSRPIRLIVPFPPGGGTDFESRVIATKVAELTGWTIVPDNRAGAGGTIGLAEAAKAEGSGHTLVMAQLDNLVIAPQFYRKLAYDALHDFQPVAGVGRAPLLLCVASDSKFRSLNQVVVAAKQAPDTITYASPGTGTVTHLAVEMFAHAAGIKLRHIPYKGSAPALADVLGGQVELLATSIPSASTQVKAGKLLPLAVTSKRRSASLPDVPSIAEQGIADFDVASWYAVFAPKTIPADIAARVNDAVNRVLDLSDVKQSMNTQGVEPIPGSAETLRELLNNELRRWPTAIQAAGVKLELG